MPLPPLPATAAAATCAALAVCYLSLAPLSPPIRTAPATRPDVSALHPPPVETRQGAVPPAFDVVRVEPDGSTLVAGTAQAGAEVALLVDGTVVARARADPSGNVVMVPPPVDGGEHLLSLRSTGPGGAPTDSESTVALAVGRGAPPFVALTSPGAPLRVMEGGPPVTGGTRVVSVESEGDGLLHVTGKASPGSRVGLTFDGTRVAEGTADASGDLAFTVRGDGRAGMLDVALVDRAGTDRAPADRVRFPVGAPGAAAPRTATVVPGDSLWRISQRAYSSGTRYTVIYGANRDRLRTPSLIHPGQVLVLPDGKGHRPTR